MRTLIREAGVARMLDHTVEWFYRHRAGLEAEGFPRPILGTGRGQRWDPAAIERWFERHERVEPAGPAAPDNHRAGAEIDARAEEIAAGIGRRVH